MDCYTNFGYTYNYYKNRFNRDSFDNAGAILTGTVHVGTNWVNAYWNGTQMVFGDGDGTNATYLSKALDVVAHELTHAVTERTAEPDLLQRVGRPQRGHVRHPGCRHRSVPGRLRERQHLEGRRGVLDARHLRRRPALHEQSHRRRPSVRLLPRALHRHERLRRGPPELRHRQPGVLPAVPGRHPPARQDHDRGDRRSA